MTEVAVEGTVGVAEKKRRLSEVLELTGWSVDTSTYLNHRENKVGLLWVAERGERTIRATTATELIRRCWREEDVDEVKARMANPN